MFAQAYRFSDGAWSKPLLILIAAVAAFCLLLGDSSAFAAKRVALVIGNNSYLSIPPLQKAVNDARAVGSVLAELGFSVAVAENLTRRDMNRSVSDLEAKVEPGDEVFFFYAGHGVAIGGENYLIPTDMPKPGEGEESLVVDEAMSVATVIRRIESRGASVAFMVLDACRDNPFAVSGTRGIGSTRGLARVDAPTGVFVLFSAGIGQTALDRLSDTDPDPNSVFTRKLVPLLRTPGMSHVALAKRVQVEVIDLAATINHKQEPAYYDQIKGEILLRFEVEVPTAGAAAPAAPSPLSEAAQAWKSIELSEDVRVLEAFRKQYGSANPLYDALAAGRLEQLAKRQQPVGESAVAALPPQTAKQAGTAELSEDPKTRESALGLDIGTRSKVQAVLQRDGYKIAYIGGTFGKDTRQAISDWQAKRGDAATGYLNDGQRDALMSLYRQSGPQSFTMALPVSPGDLGKDADPRLVQALQSLGNAPIRFGFRKGTLYIAVQSWGIRWQEARDAAEAAGGHLAVITSAGENDFIYLLFSKDERYLGITGEGHKNGPWIGLVQEEGAPEPAGGWGWVTGEKMSYRRWTEGQPNNNDGVANCGNFYSHGKFEPRSEQRVIRWDDAGCHWEEKGYIIEVPPG